MNRALLLVIACLVAATALEVSGDAIVRIGLQRDGAGRAFAFLLGAALLFGYGLLLNLAPIEFHRVVGIYIATLFVMWQLIAFIAFRAIPSVPILVGGALIVAGGLIVAFWSAGVDPASA